MLLDVPLSVAEIVELAGLAALQGAAEALPISSSGQARVARLFLDPNESSQVAALDGALHLATAAALVFAARRRVALAVRDGAAAVPAMIGRTGSSIGASSAAEDARFLVVAGASSVAVDGLTASALAPWSESPIATSLGLLVTSAALAVTSLAARPTAGRASMPRACIVGVAVGLAGFPGASRVGVALALLLALGVRASRAVDLALVTTAIALVAVGARGPTTAAATSARAITSLACLACVVATAVAGEATRRLTERRLLHALALWVVPLAIALLVYAHALS